MDLLIVLIWPGPAALALSRWPERQRGFRRRLDARQGLWSDMP